MKDYSVLIKCGTTSPEQLASVLLRMKFYPDDYRHTLARLLEGCDAIIDQSAETPSPASPAHSPTHTPNVTQPGDEPEVLTVLEALTNLCQADEVNNIPELPWHEIESLQTELLRRRRAYRDVLKGGLK